MRRPPKKAIALAASALVFGAAAVSLPAWAASSGGNAGGSNANRRPASQFPPPPFATAPGGAAKGAGRPAPLVLNGKMRKRMEKSTRCMRSHAADIPGAHLSAHGFSIGPNVDRAALSEAAKACGAPPPPPRGAALRMRLGPPPKGRPKTPPPIPHCLGAAAKRHRGARS